MRAWPGGRWIRRGEAGRKVWLRPSGASAEVGCGRTKAAGFAHRRCDDWSRTTFTPMTAAGCGRPLPTEVAVKVGDARPAPSGRSRVVSVLVAGRPPGASPEGPGESAGPWRRSRRGAWGGWGFPLLSAGHHHGAAHTVIHAHLPLACKAGRGGRYRMDAHRAGHLPTPFSHGGPPGGPPASATCRMWLRFIRALMVISLHIRKRPARPWC